jgi:8-oxo-dGTP pyrophosphatase MutT (NUDIX family)
MSVHRPGPGEEINESGIETPPRQAATIILVRGGAQNLELLLVRRHPDQRFMPGVWVFPGGAVDAHEGEGDEAHRRAAVRELAEEAFVHGVDPASLVKISRWITPVEVKIRFDTHFFLARAPDDAHPRVDGREVVDVRWASPAAALADHAAGKLPLVFPTIKHLEMLQGFTSADDALARTVGGRVLPVHPRVIGSREQARIVLPGEPGYEDT